jgi:hypothetical protein
MLASKDGCLARCASVAVVALATLSCGGKVNPAGPSAARASHPDAEADNSQTGLAPSQVDGAVAEGGAVPVEGPERGCPAANCEPCTCEALDGGDWSWTAPDGHAYSTASTPGQDTTIFGPSPFGKCLRYADVVCVRARQCSGLDNFSCFDRFATHTCQGVIAVSSSWEHCLQEAAGHDCKTLDPFAPDGTCVDLFLHRP